jgi:hypothetical protein
VLQQLVARWTGSIFCLQLPDLHDSLPSLLDAKAAQSHGQATIVGFPGSAEVLPLLHTGNAAYAMHLFTC